MSEIDGDTVTFEYGVHFSNDGCAAGFDAVEFQHCCDVVCEDFVGAEDILVVVHGFQIDALGQYDRETLFLAAFWVIFFRECAIEDMGYGLDDGVATCGFDQR